MQYLIFIRTNFARTFRRKIVWYISWHEVVEERTGTVSTCSTARGLWNSEHLSLLLLLLMLRLLLCNSDRLRTCIDNRLCLTRSQLGLLCSCFVIYKLQSRCH